MITVQYAQGVPSWTWLHVIISIILVIIAVKIALTSR